MTSCGLDDEEQTGYLNFANIIDIIDMLDLELDENEMHYIAIKMLHPTISGNQNLHYPTLVKWINELANNHDSKNKEATNFKQSERYNF